MTSKFSDIQGAAVFGNLAKQGMVSKNFSKKKKSTFAEKTASKQSKEKVTSGPKESGSKATTRPTVETPSAKDKKVKMKKPEWNDVREAFNGGHITVEEAEELLGRKAKYPKQQKAQKVKENKPKADKEQSKSAPKGAKALTAPKAKPKEKFNRGKTPSVHDVREALKGGHIGIEEAGELNKAGLSSPVGRRVKKMSSASTIKERAPRQIRENKNVKIPGKPEKTPPVNLDDLNGQVGYTVNDKRPR